MGKLKTTTSSTESEKLNIGKQLVRNTIVNLDSLAWNYRAEGNANLVLSLPDTRQALRLKKSDKSDRNKDVNKNYKFLTEVAQYIRSISKLFCPAFTIDPTLVILMVHDMEAFNKQLNMFRPRERLEKEIRYPFGIIYPDVTFLPDAYAVDDAEPTICVEIKPKQGWRFDETEANLQHFSTLFNVPAEKLTTCRFCSMQYLKLEKSKISRLSEFCPIDLFSGSTDRMLRAIRNLIDDPQNNLRVFQDGTQIYGNNFSLNALDAVLNDTFGATDKNRNLHQFASLLVKILLREDFCSNNSPTKQHQRGMEDGNLPKNSILGQVLKVQKFVQTFFLGLEKTQHLQTLDNVKMEQYCYGATALDCSLMITFKLNATSMNSTNFHHNGINFAAKIAIMDLDPKPYSHVVKYVEQTQASYQALML